MLRKFQSSLQIFIYPFTHSPIGFMRSLVYFLLFFSIFLRLWFNELCVVGISSRRRCLFMSETDFGFPPKLQRKMSMIFCKYFSYEKSSQLNIYSLISCNNQLICPLNYYILIVVFFLFDFLSFSFTPEFALLFNLCSVARFDDLFSNKN